ncbi:MAG: hypothetical protein IJ822_05305 [Pyramidobacter sp.]|nr:hypothetical protein [Pyramidobacter sp.]
MKVRKWIKLCVAVVLCGSSLAACAAEREQTNARVEALLEAAGRRAEGRAMAASLRAELDSRVTHEPLLRLWKRAVGRDETQRLDAAWSIMRTWCPEGDVSRWAEVDYFEVPSEKPRPLMVIDALYAALIELRRTEAGVWLASELLKEFSRSSHGRYDFIGVCPAPVAEAVEDIAARTGMIGLWKPRQTVGQLPIARSVHGAVSDSYAMDRGMQFLDGAGRPANNGFYAWDRKSVNIYRIRILSWPRF